MAGISVLIGSERGTSSTCPECGRRHKPKGRTWNCPNAKCSYKHKHRDIIGSLMMQVLAYGEKPEYPEQIKYLRPVRTGSSRWLDTAQSSLKLARKCAIGRGVQAPELSSGVSPLGFPTEAPFVRSSYLKHLYEGRSFDFCPQY